MSISTHILARRSHVLSLLEKGRSFLQGSDQELDSITMFESLEPRVLLSGDIFASVANGHLNIIGDAAANAIVIDQNDLAAGQVRITATDGTTINGASDPVVLSGLTRNVLIRLGTGNDVVTMNGLSLPGNVIIDAQEGANVITLNSVDVANSLIMTNRSRNELTTTVLTDVEVGQNLILLPSFAGQDVTLDSVDVNGLARIITGNGDDAVTIEDSTFERNLQVFAGQGANDVSLQGVEAKGVSALIFGSHDDNLTVEDSSFDNRLLVLAGHGENDVSLQGVEAKGVSALIFGSHDDNLTVEDSSFDNRLLVLAGHGENNVVLRNIEARNASTFAFGKDNDTLLIDDSTFEGIFRALTGNGNDLVEIDVNGASDGPATVFHETMITALGGGDDSLQLGIANDQANQVQFKDRLLFHGGPGSDTLLFDNAVASAERTRWLAFESTLGEPDVTAPLILSVTPDGDNVAVNSAIIVTFNEAMDRQTLNSDNFVVRGPNDAVINGQRSFIGNVATFTPDDDFVAGATYTLTITTGATDLSGNALAAEQERSFTTGNDADVTAPTVTLTNPSIGAAQVALNATITAAFSETIDPTSIIGNFLVHDSQDELVVGGLVHNQTDQTLTFTPDGLLDPNETYTVTITGGETGIKDIAGNPLALDYVWAFETAAEADVTAPAVTLTNPDNNANPVPLNETLIAGFSEAIDPTTVDGNFTVLDNDDNPVAGELTHDQNNHTLTFTPEEFLAPVTTYTVTITGGANGMKDIAGNALAADYVWSFTSAEAADLAAPTVTLTNPTDAGTGIPLGTTISAAFSETLLDASTEGNLVVRDADNQVIEGALVHNQGNQTLTFTPAGALAPSTTFTATITGGANGVKDLAGNALAADFVWTFTTAAAADVLAPTVTLTNPDTGASDVALSATVTATFSEAIDPATVDGNFVVVDADANTVSGNLVHNQVNHTLRFTPDDLLTANTEYTVTITGGQAGIADAAGNRLTENYVWSFTTGDVVDDIAPTVAIVSPEDIEANVDVNTSITAQFSEAMVAGSVTTDPITEIATVTVTAPGSVLVPGIVSYDSNTNTMTFTPTEALASETTFVVRITTRATDLASIPLENDFVWSFTTGEGPDEFLPEVTQVSPQNFKTNVAINKIITATFSEDMDEETITGINDVDPGNITVTGPGLTPVDGTLSYDALTRTVSFTPDSDLALNTTFTVTISSNVRDLAGNGLESDEVWEFTTGSQIAQQTIALGDAGPFAVMATSSITVANTSSVTGDVGVNPGTSQELTDPQVDGTIYGPAAPETQAAQDSLLLAYNDAVSRSTTPVSLPGNMGGLTFFPGLYINSTSVLISGAGPSNNVTLDAQGDPNAVFIFKMGSTLTTGPGSQVILIGGAKAANVFWLVETSATIDTTSIFKGNILAQVSITVNSGANVEGRLFAGSAGGAASVTLDAATIVVPLA